MLVGNYSSVFCYIKKYGIILLLWKVYQSDWSS